MTLYPEFAGLDHSQLQILEEVNWESTALMLEDLYVPFVSGEITPLPETNEKASLAAGYLAELHEIGVTLNRKPHIRIQALPLVGENSGANTEIQRTRLRLVQDALVRAGIAPESLTGEIINDIQPDPDGVRGIIFLLNDSH